MTSPLVQEHLLHGTCIALSKLLPFRQQLVRYISLLAAILFSIATSLPATSNSVAPPDDGMTGQSLPHSLKFRVVWGGGTEQVWSGSIRLTSGRIDEVSSLRMDPDGPSTLWLEQDRILFRREIPTRFDGVDFEVKGFGDSEIVLELFKAGETAVPVLRHTLHVRDLLNAHLTLPVDEEENRLTISRVPGDQIQVDFDRPHLVFGPGENWKIRLLPNHVSSLAGRKVTMQARLYPARKLRPVLNRLSWSVALDSTGNGSPVECSLSTPLEEGVYDLHLDIEAQWSQASFQSSRVHRIIQFVVIDPQLRAPPASAEQWKSTGVVSLNPDFRSRALQQWPVFQSSGSQQTTEASNAWATLPPGEWQTVEIPVSEPGKPHRVEIEFDGRVVHSAGFSILQPDETGNIPAIGVDSGSALGNRELSASSAGDVSTLTRHVLYFWPRHSRPLLLISNRHADKSLRIGRIEVSSGPDRLPASGSPPGASESKRRQGLSFYEAPLFAERYSASRFVSEQSPQPIDDWITCYEAADRWIQHLQAGGYSGGILTIAAEGGAIAPLGRLAPSPRFDSGVFHPEGADPVQKDVVEMVARMFDRAGLTLVPSIELVHSTPALAHLLRAAPPDSPDPVRLVNRDGQFAPASGASSFDPLLDPVQKEIRSVVEEVAARYGNHPSVTGVGLNCRPESWIHSTDVESGFHELSMRQFAEETGLEVSGDVAMLRTTIQGNEVFPAWLKWRSLKMQTFYQSLQDLVGQYVAGGRLFILQADMLDRGFLAQRLNPRLHYPTRFAEIALLAGWDQWKWNGDGPVMMRSSRIAPQELSMEHRSTANSRGNLNQIFPASSGFTGQLFVNRSVPFHYLELERQNPFGNQTSAIVRLQPMTPPAEFSRKRFVESIFQSDLHWLADGGWLPPSGTEDEAGKLLAAWNQLPQTNFFDVNCQSHPPGASPVVVRYGSDSTSGYIYAVNASPWPVGVRIVVAGKMLQEPESFGDCRLQRQTPNDESVLSGMLPPFSLAVCKSSDPDFAATTFNAEVSTDASRSLQESIFRLQNLLAIETQGPGLPVIRNADFEMAGNDLAGWRWSEQIAGAVTMRQLPDGNRCVSLQSSGSPVWIRSSEFPIPETGRLSLSVRVRRNSNASVPLRLCVETTAGFPAWYRFGTIEWKPGGTADEDKWEEFVVHFDDLPVDPQTKLRVGCDLMGSGQLLIDDFKIQSTMLDDRDRRALKQLVATSARLLDDPAQIDRCRRIIESFWPQYLIELHEKAASQSTVSDKDDAAGNQESSLHESTASATRSGWRLRRPRGLQPLRNERIR